jgi:hypothetical protein
MPTFWLFYSLDKSIGSGCFLAKFPIPENCSAHVPMILKEFCSSKINGLVMKTFSGK